jgi:hypothetical protein
VNCSDSAGSFSCTVPGPNGKGLKLKGGLSGKTYWVGIVANQSFLTERQWALEETNGGGGNAGVWQNPGNGFATGCTTWAPPSGCFGFGTNEWAFDLQGTTN